MHCVGRRSDCASIRYANYFDRRQQSLPVVVAMAPVVWIILPTISMKYFFNFERLGQGKWLAKALNKKYGKPKNLA